MFILTLNRLIFLSIPTLLCFRHRTTTGKLWERRRYDTYVGGMNTKIISDVIMNQLGKKREVERGIVKAIHMMIKQTSITISIVLLLLHLYGWNFATRAKVSTRTGELAGMYVWWSLNIEYEGIEEPNCQIKCCKVTIIMWSVLVTAMKCIHEYLQC